MWSLSSWGSEGTRSRSSSCVALLVHESGAQDCCHAPLFLLFSRVLKIVIMRRSSYSDHRHVPLWMTTFWTGTACPSRTSHRRSTMPWVHKDEPQRFPPSWHASVDVWSSDIWSRIGGNISRWDQSHVNTRHEFLDWFGPSRGVITLRLVLMYYAIEIGSSLFLLGSFRIFRGCHLDVFWILLEMSRGCFFLLLDVDLSSLFIIGESPHRV
jgi:hypothetical protein